MDKDRVAVILLCGCIKASYRAFNQKIQSLKIFNTYTPLFH